MSCNMQQNLIPEDFYQVQKHVLGNKTFYIQEDSNYVTSNAKVRCKNKNCRKRYQIRCNSFFKYFPKIKLRIISEIIKSFICREMNAPSIINFLKSNYNIDVGIVTVRDILNEIRKYFFDIISQNTNQKYK